MNKKEKEIQSVRTCVRIWIKEIDNESACSLRRMINSSIHCFNTSSSRITITYNDYWIIPIVSNNENNERYCLIEESWISVQPVEHSFNREWIICFEWIDQHLWSSL